ncbi:MAG: PQQ-binding-like beta-propeller repeat protein [Acidobacteria bacterium]|nr:PQQ-binding-like beta-propeller repeat protein [Acidobacteriota bacterium]
MHWRFPGYLFLILLGGAPAICQKRTVPAGYRAWEVFGGGADNIHYSTLKQINRSNVHKLKIAWTHDTGDAFAGSEMQCNPIIVGGVLYATTPKMRLLALDAATGALVWKFEPPIDTARAGRRNRGVTYWTDGKTSRVFFCPQPLSVLALSEHRPAR